MSLLLIISLIWLISELSLSYIKRSSTNSEDLDRFSLRVLWLTIGVSVTLGIYPRIARIGFINYYSEKTYVAGIILICLGLLLRWIAILQLKKHFTVDVSIREDHQLIQKGLYNYIRHPAYSGSLLSFFGLGLAFNNWLSLLIIFLPILFAFFYRISVEEAELHRAFGRIYEEYTKKTKRLIPWVY